MTNPTQPAAHTIEDATVSLQTAIEHACHQAKSRGLTADDISWQLERVSNAIQNEADDDYD